MVWRWGQQAEQVGSFSLGDIAGLLPDGFTSTKTLCCLGVETGEEDQTGQNKTCDFHEMTTPNETDENINSVFQHAMPRHPMTGCECPHAQSHFLA